MSKIIKEVEVKRVRLIDMVGDQKLVSQAFDYKVSEDSLFQIVLNGVSQPKTSKAKSNISLLKNDYNKPIITLMEGDKLRYFYLYLEIIGNVYSLPIRD